MQGMAVARGRLHHAVPATPLLPAHSPVPLTTTHHHSPRAHHHPADAQ